MDLWRPMPTLLRDITLTGTAVAMFVSQIFSARPSGVLLWAAVVLAAGNGALHAPALTRDSHGPTGGQSSLFPPAQPPGPSGSSPHGGADE